MFISEPVVRSDNSVVLLVNVVGNGATARVDLQIVTVGVVKVGALTRRGRCGSSYAGR
jgi:hypothetical protein